MYKPELLAPAGDLEKLKVAIIYGADAVFIGGKKYSLRAKANNFEIKDIEEAVIFAHEHKAKVHITVNIYPHQEDLEPNEIDSYLKELDQAGVDAIIVSSPYIIRRAKELKCKFAVHVSTQQSCANVEAINFWQEQGVDRVVLARELTLLELQDLTFKTKMPLEVFIHGGLCSSFSGRCSLSNYLTLRDANRGGCAHSCRWFYELKENGQPLSNTEEEFRLGSKDLCAIELIPSLLDLQIASFKIEGRMKSLNYIACVVQAYRSLIDDYLKDKKHFNRYDFSKYLKMVARAENRETTLAWLANKTDSNSILYNKDGEQPLQDFLGIIHEYDAKASLVAFEERNHFEVGDEVSIIQPHSAEQTFMISEIYNEKMEPLSVANVPLQKIYLKVPFKVADYSIIRLVNKA